jgi:co-chaperonin GroES (HSP10)
MQYKTANYTITPLTDKIYFKFTENVTSTGFMPKTKNGFLITDVHGYQEIHSPKWGEVIAHGPDVNEEIKSHKYILVEPGKWSPGINFDSDRFWMSEENFIMAVSNDESATYRF